MQAIYAKARRVRLAIFDVDGVLTDGTLYLTDGGEEILRAGDCAGFPGGQRDGHCLQNRSSADAEFLVVGSRNDADHGEYSDIDMVFMPGRYSGKGGYRRKDGSAL